jgi:flagellar biosynthesis protein FlhG
MSPDRPTESLMAVPSDVRRAQPGDQADGLRRLFSTRTVRFIPVVSNPFVAQESVLIRQVCAALEQLGLYTLLVDVCDHARVPTRDMADRVGHHIDLADRIQVLTDRTASLSARGLPARWTDTGGSTQAFLQAVIDAAPLSQAVVVHGSASELARMFGRGELHMSRPRPIVICDEQADSMTHAYAALKVLSQRADWVSHDLLVSAATGSAGIRLVKDRLAQCAALFFGGVRHDSVDIDPRAVVLPATASASLMAFMEASMNAAAAFVLPEMGRRGPAPVTSSPFLQPMV